MQRENKDVNTNIMKILIVYLKHNELIIHKNESTYSKVINDLGGD